MISLYSYKVCYHGYPSERIFTPHSLPLTRYPYALPLTRYLSRVTSHALPITVKKKTMVISNSAAMDGEGALTDVGDENLTTGFNTNLTIRSAGNSPVVSLTVCFN